MIGSHNRHAAFVPILEKYVHLCDSTGSNRGEKQTRPKDAGKAGICVNAELAANNLAIQTRSKRLMHSLASRPTAETCQPARHVSARRLPLVTEGDLLNHPNRPEHILAFSWMSKRKATSMCSPHRRPGTMAACILASVLALSGCAGIPHVDTHGILVTSNVVGATCEFTRDSDGDRVDSIVTQGEQPVVAHLTKDSRDDLTLQCAKNGRESNEIDIKARRDRRGRYRYPTRIYVNVR